MDGRLWRQTARAAVAAALACMLFAGTAWPAFADDGQPAAPTLDELDNRVNPQQMPDSSFLYDTSIYDLVHADASYDGTTVRVTGEVVGDAIGAEAAAGPVESAWVTLESTDASREGSIEVLLDADDLALIDTYGGYGRHGTTLQVQGEFHLACMAHEGIVDIHATRVSAVAAGSTEPDELNWPEFRTGAILVAAGALLALLVHVLQERQR